MDSTIYPLWPLLPFAGLVLILTLRYPAHIIFTVALGVSVLPGEWEIAGLKIDPTDLCLAGLFFSLFVAAKISPFSFRYRVPRYRLWLLLAAVSVIAYLVAPAFREYLTNPIRIGYQLYRYALRDLLFFPLAALLITDKRKLQLALVAVVLAVDASAISAILEGMVAGDRTGGFFGSNGVGGAFMLPILVCIGGLLSRRSAVQVAFHLTSLILILRALQFSWSRVSAIAILAAVVLYGFGLMYWSGARPRAMRLALVLVVAVEAIFLAKPDVLHRPNIQRFISIGNPMQQHTFQWRYQERWPYFWKKAVENPWFGTGQTEDFSLGTWANTPHNGYLAIAVEKGFPALAIVLTFAILATTRASRVFLQSTDPQLRLIGLTCACTIVGLFTHSIAESTFIPDFVERVFWFVTAISLQLGRGGFSQLASESRPPRRQETDLDIPIEQPVE